MEPAHPKPTRKRRHWLIVALLLVLVSLCSWWWLIPRGLDPRLIGTWQTNRNTNTTWKLEADGTLSMFANGGFYRYGRWAVRSNRLHVIPSAEVIPFAIVNSVISSIRHGRSVPPWPRYDIESASPDLINMKDPGEPSASFTFQRIPE